MIISSGLTGFTGKIRTTEHTGLHAEMYVSQQVTLSKNQESAFITSGFNNWKDTTRTFELHRRSDCHREAMFKWEHHKRGVGIDLQLQRRLAAEQIELPVQNFYLNWVSSSTGTTITWSLGRERGIFINLWSFGQLILMGWKTGYSKDLILAHEVQNEMMRIMAHQIQRCIYIRTSMWICVSADKTVDISLMEQYGSYKYNYYCGCNNLH